MIEKYCEEILEKRRKGESLSALEQVLFHEYLEAEKPQVLEFFRKRRRQAFLNRIALRKAEEAAYGEGTGDVVLARFEHSVGRKPQRWQIYQLMHDHSSQEIARELGMSLSEVIGQETVIMGLYGGIGNPGKRAPRSVAPALAIATGPCRTFIRKDRTGLVEYRFCYKTRRTGSATVEILPGFPMVIRTEDGMILNSSFDVETTIHPGLYRDITDADNPTVPVARLVWNDWGEHELHLPGGKIMKICTRGERHYFYLDDRMVAKTNPLPENQKATDGFELCGCMKLCEETDDTTALLMQLFPVIRFGM